MKKYKHKQSHSYLLASSSSHNQSHPFTAFSKWISNRTGHPVTFALAVGIIILWVISGPFFGYSATWQLMINTGTTIVTFLMVFLIQNSTNRESAAVQIKLDELIRADKDAHTVLLDLEQLTEKELLDLKGKYEELAKLARKKLRAGGSDKGSPELRV